jgi:hypothetical protein
MAFTLDQLDALDAALAQGVLEVEYADKRVKYRSLSEMLEMRRLMASVLGQVPPSSGRRLASFDKGVGC